MSSKIFIVHFDKSGGVLASSKSLSHAFHKNSVNAEELNAQRFQGSILTKMLKCFFSIFSLRKTNSVFLMMHFESIFIGVALRLFGVKNIVNVFHTDIVAYHKRNSFFKKTFFRMFIRAVSKFPSVFVSQEACVKAVNEFFFVDAVCIYMSPIHISEPTRPY